MSARLRNLSSYTCQSIWTTRKVLEMGLCWRVGFGERINLITDAWIPGSKNYRISSLIRNSSYYIVSKLIDKNSRTWEGKYGS